MPVRKAEIDRQNGTPDLTDGEKLYIRTVILVFEATGTQPPAADLELAFAACGADQRQLLRALMAKYKGGETIISGGTDAMQYKPALDRWAIRNGVRATLSDTGLVNLPQELMPAQSDSLQLFSIGLGSFGTTSEFW